MRRRPRILVDCDGVLADFVLLYLELHQQLNGKAHGHADVTSFDFSQCVATKEEDENVWRHIDKTPGLIRDLATIPHALRGLEELRTLGDVVCVTSPHVGPTWVPERFRWLMDRAGFKKREVVFRSDKDYEPGDCLIDDKLDAVLSWSVFNSDGVGIVFDRPHNQSELPKYCLRAKGWSDVVRLVRDAVEV